MEIINDQPPTSNATTRHHSTHKRTAPNHISQYSNPLNFQRFYHIIWLNTSITKVYEKKVKSADGITLTQSCQQQNHSEQKKITLSNWKMIKIVEIA